MASSPWQPPAVLEMAGASGLPVTLALPGIGDLLADDIDWRPSYRVITSEYAGENLFERLPNAEEFEAYRAIADLTNPNALHEAGAIELVPPADRIYGPGAGLIMAAFTWPGRPSRFSDGTRGTYYAALHEATAICETRYHDTRFLQGAGPVVLAKTVIEASLDARLVDVREGRPAPPGVDHPQSYMVGQAFGQLVRRLEGDGIVYDSVRHRDATGRALGGCAAMFRPSLLHDAVAARTLEYHWDGQHISVR